MFKWKIKTDRVGAVTQTGYTGTALESNRDVDMN